MVSENSYFAIFELVQVLNSGCDALVSVLKTKWGRPFGWSYQLHSPELFVLPL